MNTSFVRRHVVGLIVFLAVVVAGCAQLPPPTPQQDIQELRERIATLEARAEEREAESTPTSVLQQEVQALREQVATLGAQLEERQATPAPTPSASMDEMMSRMAELQQRMNEMKQQGAPDPEALTEMQQQMQPMMGRSPGAPGMDQMIGPISQMMGMMQGMMQMMGRGQAAPDVDRMMDQMSQMMTMMQTMMQMMATPEAQAQRQPMMGGMEGMEQTAGDFAPLVRGLYEGEELFFIHTEASDPQVAQMLTEMMGPRVVLLPKLAGAPEELLANVYVFTNGVEGDGPFGFQPDVFDAVPGDEGYSPLRAVNLVTWQEGAEARVLGSAEEVQEAESAGEISIERSRVVVNMPVLVWPGGHR